jgi:predicted RNA polymerase sigma factor
MVALYAALVAVTGSSVAELNRGIAISRAYGPAAGLAVLDPLRDRPELRGYHLLPSARGDLLAQLGQADQAREQFQRAAALTANEAERAMLLRRSAEL